MEIIIYSSTCAGIHSPCPCRFRRAIVTAEALTVYVVIIILTIIRLVKRLVVVLDGLQLLCILVLVIDSQAIGFIACIRYSSWVCTVTCEVAKLRYDTLATHIDVLGVLTTLPCHEVWADIKAEACCTSIAT